MFLNPLPSILTSGHRKVKVNRIHTQKCGEVSLLKLLACYSLSRAPRENYKHCWVLDTGYTTVYVYQQYNVYHTHALSPGWKARYGRKKCIHDYSNISPSPFSTAYLCCTRRRDALVSSWEGKGTLDPES